jgi:ornithine cyclodeaminase/alanine dehydrogenase-like protein (mu-crystallin family)
MGECIGVMEKTLAELARGEAILPLRSILWLPERVGALGLMPAALLPSKVVGVKAITFFHGNEGTELDTHQGAVLLFEAERGQLLAVIDATSITAIRTAAVSGVATKLLAREDAGDLAIVGSGVQAGTHLEAMLAVRPIRRVRVASKDFARAQRFADRESKRQGIAIEPMRTIEAAVRGADIVCTATSARDPVVAGDWLEPGSHVNAVGSSVPFARELDTAAVVRSRLFVDRRESATNEAGDFLIARKEGAVGDDHILGEVGEVAIGKVPGRRSREEITLFKSLGLAVEDVASAAHIFEKAKASGEGRWIELGGARHEGD